MSRFATMAVVGLLTAAPLTSPAPAQDKPVELRFSHWMPSTDPVHAAAEAWGKSIEAASNGTIVVRIAPAEQLGKAFDHYDMALNGTVDIALVNPGYEPGRFPVMGLSEMPFMVANAKQGSAALDAWYRKYADQEMEDVKYCLTFAHGPATFHTNRKVATPADLSDMRIRPDNVAIARLISLKGGTNVPASVEQARALLEKDGADGVTLPWGSVVRSGIDRVTTFHLDAPLYVTAHAIVLNKAKYDALTPAQRKVIDDHCTPQWSETIATPWATMEAAGRDKIRTQSGQELYRLTPAELKEWRKAAAPLRKEWEALVKTTGQNPGAIHRDLQTELKKRKALY